MDLRDMWPILEEFGITLGKTLDVGCGTGRLAQICGEYQGVDISPSMVEYCKRAGIQAELIDGPFDLHGEYEWVTCLSVFTHIPRSERRHYLERFGNIAPNLLVDIIPGEEGGSIALWQADVETFEADLKEHGFKVLGVHECISPDGAFHRCYRCSQR